MLGVRTRFTLQGRTSWPRRLIYPAIIIIVPISTTILLAELVLRQIGLGDPILYYTNATYRYAPKPNQMKHRPNNAVVSLDRYGLRGPTHWNTKTNYRILFIGDSVTWSGTSIDDRDTFPAQVCEHLRRHLDKTFVCGNAGVNAYGVDNMTARIRYRTFNNEHAIVVTLLAADTLRGLTSLNALPYFSRKPPEPIPAIWEATAFVLTRLNQDMRPVRHVKPNLKRTLGTDELTVVSDSLDNLLKILTEEQRKGKKILLVYSPDKFEAEGGNHAISHHIKDILQRSGLPFLDMTETMHRPVVEDFYLDDVHLDVHGHAVYGETIGQAMRILFQTNEHHLD